MKNQKKATIFLVDDDAVFLKSLEIEFMLQGNFNIEAYPSGEICMDHLANEPDIIILDYHLDGINKHAMNGMHTLCKIKALNSGIPVIMLSSQDKIEVAVNCMHNGAFDYVVKSETAFMRLQKIITEIYRYKKIEKELNWYMERM